ncbi:PadR family transcriptional regulator [Arthrobacter sp. RIT-PI-e]|uniref:PadR family transcriptional regulator n=1 Tax=Arthrobacter sp. RIT-PI-e TaxID=1681197 RepID=UPI0006760C1C|nr:PadR family transcriptional regulator [Arthrobacter sp. RIT-PI-e]KNC19892.1 PadR family transcriptional regulator [Arthrobacter sp. RIT-PI-e]
MSRIQAQQDAQLTRAVLPLLTLTLLADEESYGYQLIERLADLGLEVTTGLMYPLLSRLERDGMVSTRMVPSTSGPPRKYFALTEDGHTTRASVRQQWQIVATAVDLATEKENTPHA